MSKPSVVIIVKRKLGALQTGANVYLSVLLCELREAGFSINLVFAPESSFGNLPVASIGQHFDKICDKLYWEKTIRIGRYFVSTSYKVYFRFIKRIFEEIVSKFDSAEKRTRIAHVSEPLESHEKRVVSRIAGKISPDLVVSEYSSLGPVLNDAQLSGTKKCIFLHDLFSLRAEAMRRKNRQVDFADLTVEEEAAMCRSADVLIYASQPEKDTFKPLLPDCKHIWLAPHRDAGPAIPPSGHPKALFMGVRHSGNLDAVEFLMEDIWPKVVERKPDAELWIVGEIGLHLNPSWSKMPGVKILGFVNDLKPLGGADTIGLAPTRVASGISIKFVDYMNLGMAILASDIAIEGYGGPLGKVVKSAESAEDFATRLVELLDDQALRHSLAHQIREDGLRLLGNDEIRMFLRELSPSD